MKIKYYVEFGERSSHTGIGRLHGIEKFEGEIENFILNTFINFKPVKRFENRSGVSEFQLRWCCFDMTRRVLVSGSQTMSIISLLTRTKLA